MCVQISSPLLKAEAVCENNLHEEERLENNDVKKEEKKPKTCVDGVNLKCILIQTDYVSGIPPPLMQEGGLHVAVVFHKVELYLYVC